MGNKITYDMLVRANACDTRYDFADYFGTEVEVTKKLVLEYMGKLNVDFIAEHFFPKHVRDEYFATKNKILSEFRTKTREINNKYEIDDYQCRCEECRSKSKHKTDDELVAALHARYKKQEALRKATDNRTAALFADMYNSLPADIHELDPVV